MSIGGFKSPLYTKDGSVGTAFRYPNDANRFYARYGAKGEAVMNAELIAVGTEILLGDIVNTDAQLISQGLS